MSKNPTPEQLKEMRLLLKETLKEWLIDIPRGIFIETATEYWQSSLTLLLMFVYLGVDSQPEPWLVLTLMVTGIVFFTKGIINEYIKNDN